MTRRVIFVKALLFMLAVFVATSGSAPAADLPKEGPFDYTACWSGVNNVITFSPTHSAFSFELTGTTRSAQPDGFADKHTFRCVGSNHVFAGKSGGTSICEAVDAAGDKRLTYFSFDGDKTVREQVAGTGKYDGMVFTSATVQPIGPFPTIKPGTFQACNRQTGTYKLK